MKRTILFSAMCLLAMLSAYKTTAQVVASGTTGACTWELTGTSSNYMLTISGAGAMGDYSYNYSGGSTAPWNSYRSGIKTLDIQQGVTTIGNYAFQFCSGLTSLTIPNSVTTIGNEAFRHCNLTSVTIGNSVTSIGASAFSDCSGLTSLTIPNSVTTIGDAAFGSCSGLTSVTIGNSVTTIGSDAFYGCSGLTSLTIPNSVTTIGDAAFGSCTGLTTVNFNATNCTSMGSSSFPVFNGCSAFSTLVIGDNVQNIPYCAFYNCSNLTSVTIGNSLTTIGSDAFSGCSSLTSIDVDADNPNYSSIDGVLFNKLQNTLIQYPYGKTGSYTIPSSVTTIGNYAFGYCSGLTSVIIGNSVTTIGDYAFRNCSSLTSVTIGNSVKTIGGSAFYNCSGLTSVTIGNSVKTIGNYAFGYCSGLTSVIIGNSVTTIGQYAFRDCSGLTTVNFNATNCTFMGTSSSNPVFSGCSAFSTLVIGNNVQTIPNYAFSGCSALSSITNLNPVPQTISNSTVFNGVNQSACVLTVPNSGISAYQNAVIWQDFAPNIVAGGLLLSAYPKHTGGGSVSSTPPNGLYPLNTAVTLTATMPADYIFLEWISGETSLGNVNPLSFTLTQDTVILANIGKLDTFDLATAGTLKNQTGIKTVTHLTLTGSIDARDIQFMRDSLPILAELDISGATIVEYYGAKGTVYNSNVTYPANEMPQYSFYTSGTGAKKNLTLVQLPTSITSIGNYAFNGCSGLSSITIPNLVTTIGGYAFSSCSGLTAVNFNATNCTSMNYSVFSDCSAFSTLTIGSNVETIPANAFSGRSGLTAVTIPNSVTTIGTYAFSGCSGLTSLTIGNSVTTIGAAAFSGCSALTSLTIPNSVTTIGGYAFYGCSGLTEITSHAIVPPAAGNAFINVPVSIPVYIPCLTYLAYQNAPDWGGYFTNIVVNGASSSDTTFYSAQICYGNPYNDANFSNLDIQGVYTASLENAAGCDSVIVLSLSVIDPPQQQELCMISVDNYNHNEIVWKRAEIVDHYNIYREGASSEQYDWVASIDYNDSNQWVDASSNASIMSYKYKVSGVDSCGNESELSSSHKAMRLTIYQSPNGWNLIWTPYEGVDYQSYNIYRSASATSEMEQIGSISSSNTSFTDVSATSEYVYYAVGIALEDPCSQASIRSNVATNYTSSIATGNYSNSAVGVYPNPAKDNITVTLPENVSKALFTLYDMQGKALLRQEINSGDAVEVRHLATGIYLYQVAAGDQRYQGKVVKR